MTTWDDLAAQHGARAVMDLGISDAELDAETARQWPLIEAMLRPLLNGSEQLALDFGCGVGRFTPRLADLTSGAVIGYDPCKRFIAMAPLRAHPTVHYTAQMPHGYDFDLVFVAMVLGDPGQDIFETARTITSLLAPGGLLIVLEHCVTNPAPYAGRWWRFRNAEEYRRLFFPQAPLDIIGSIMQLSNPVTILAGRKP